LKEWIVVVYSASTGEKIKEIVVYAVNINPKLERDVQEIYVTELKVEESGSTMLVVKDERNRTHYVDISDFK
jgi:hypothetical protein